VSDTTIDVKPPVAADRIVLAIVAIVVLAFGGTLLGGWSTPTVVADPVAYVQGLYDGGDADAFFDAIDAGAAEMVGATADQLRQFTAAWVALPTTVTPLPTLDVYGAVLPVVTAQNGQGETTWCVRSDGALLPFCVIGTIPTEVRTGAIQATATPDVAVLVPDVAFVQVMITLEQAVTAGEDPVIQATAGWEDAEVLRLDPFVGGLPVQPGETIEAGTQLIVSVQRFHDLTERLEAGVLTLRFVEGDVEVAIGEPQLLVVGTRR